MTLDNMTGITKGSYTGGDLFCKSQLITCNRVNECNGVCPFEDALRHADKAHEADAQTIEPTDCSSCDHYHESETEDGYICECFADTAHTDLISRADAIEAVMAEGRNVHASEYANAERIIHEADAVEALSMLPSADRPTEYNLEIIADTVRQLGHLDSYIADTYLRPNNKIHIQMENIFSDDCYFIEDDKYILAELEKIATDKDDCVEFTLTNNKKVIIHSADRPKGEWLDEDGDKVEIDDDGITEDSCWCSVCGEWLVASDEYPTKGYFCPNCGADMRKE